MGRSDDGVDEGNELAGQVALLTGGTRGLGLVFAQRLAAAGARVAITGRSAATVDAVAAEHGFLGLVGDVSSEEAVERWVSSTEAELGPIDVLVNNAGIADEAHDVWAEDPQGWWRIFEVNVLGPFLCCRAVLPGMLGRGHGRIVNLTSGAAYSLPSSLSRVLRSSYGPSKAALHRFTEQLAYAVGDRGVGVFSLSPGPIKTEMTSDFPEDMQWLPAERPAELLYRIAAGRLDALAGRVLGGGADLDELERRQQEIVSGDGLAIRVPGP
jgi:NAD(P)-dependent dehydrogenase (short-subunit alcohol dehydrogenase family)